MSPKGRASIQFLAAGPLVGAVGGGVAGLIPTALGGSLGAGVILFLAGLAGGAFGVSLCLLAPIALRGPASHIRPPALADAVLSISGALSGWLTFYLIFLRDQHAWGAAPFLGILGSVTSVLLFVLLRIGRGRDMNRDRDTERSE